MNPIWQNFLLSAQADGNTSTDIMPMPSGGQRLCPLAYLGVLTVSGKDAATLLHGQITCNINDVSETHSSLGAVCNHKGRAIATFLLIKQADAFHLLVPLELLETLKKRLSLFILRSSVTLTDNTQAYCLLGLSPTPQDGWLATRQDTVIRVQLDGRALILAEPDAAMAFWTTHSQQGYTAENSAYWRLRDISCGIPWLSVATSEEFVPQMFNLDKLGGISFNKGCYTGQEIIARTHYLGKSKRGLVLVQTLASVPPANTTILDAHNDTVGQVLMAQADGQQCLLLIVVQLTEKGGVSENAGYPLKLVTGEPLTVLPFATASVLSA